MPSNFVSIGKARGPFPRRQLGFIQRQLNDTPAYRVRDIVCH